MEVTSFAISIYDDLVKNIKMSAYFNLLTYTLFNFLEERKKVPKNGSDLINASKKGISRGQFTSRHFYPVSVSQA